MYSTSTCTMYISLIDCVHDNMLVLCNIENIHVHVPTVCAVIIIRDLLFSNCAMHMYTHSPSICVVGTLYLSTS